MFLLVGYFSVEHSLSMQTLVEFGRMEAVVPRPPRGKTLHLSNETLMEMERAKKLEIARKQLEEFKAIRDEAIARQDYRSGDGGLVGMTQTPTDDLLGGSESLFRGVSNLTLVSLDGSGMKGLVEISADYFLMKFTRITNYQ